MVRSRGTILLGIWVSQFYPSVSQEAVEKCHPACLCRLNHHRSRSRQGESLETGSQTRQGSDNKEKRRRSYLLRNAYPYYKDPYVCYSVESCRSNILAIFVFSCELIAGLGIYE
jgi:hypothetical protein